LGKSTPKRDNVQCLHCGRANRTLDIAIRRPMKPRTLAQSALLILATVVAGLTIRFAPLGLPPVLVKYGGSTLWAAMIYWIVTAIFPAWRVPKALFVSGCLATAVEFFKLYRSPGMDAFRGTIPGMLLLGRYFSTKDVVAYWLAIAAAAVLDVRIRGTQRRTA
jgi:hypothetical protein